MRRALGYAWLVLACAGCMGTRSASLGVDEPREDVREDDEGGAEPSDEPPETVADAAVGADETDDAGGDSEPGEPSRDEPAEERDGGSDASEAELDAGRGERRDAQVRDGGRDGATYTNPICRIEPWHCT